MRCRASPKQYDFLAGYDICANRFRNGSREQANSNEQSCGEHRLQNVYGAGESSGPEDKTHENPEQGRSGANSLQNVDSIADSYILPPTRKQTEIGQQYEAKGHEKPERKKKSEAKGQAEIKPQQPGNHQRTNEQARLEYANKPPPVTHQQIGSIGHFLFARGS